MDNNIRRQLRRLQVSLPAGISPFAIEDFVHGTDRYRYENSGGRNFMQLVALIGQRATVWLRHVEWDDGCREWAVNEQADVLITEFNGFDLEPEYSYDGDEIYEAGRAWHPVFTVEDDRGVTLRRVYLRELLNIRPT